MPSIGAKSLSFNRDGVAGAESGSLASMYLETVA